MVRTRLTGSGRHLKEGYRACKENYRPMSVLPVVARLFQKMDNGRISEIVLFDLNKAIDTVDHTILCQKLDQNGLQLNELLWLNCYPFNRKQLCKVGSCESDINNIDVRVPQGSCLRSLLFLIYANYFPKVVNASTVFMYADDTSPTFQSQDISQLNRTIHGDIKHLDLWMDGNKLSVNVSKTQSIFICTRPKHQKLKTAGDNLCLNTWGKGLDMVQKVKHFGVQVDNSLDGKE